MTPKEALKEISNTTISSRMGDWGIESRYVSDLSSTKEPLRIIKQALTELEELKQRDTPMKWIDVVDETGHYDKCPVCGYPSYNDLGHNHFCTVCGQRLEFEEVGNEE